MVQLPGIASDLPVTAQDIRAAADRISGSAVRTPLLEFASLNAQVGHRVLIKYEGVQRTGAFKFRGAYNRLLLIPIEQRGAGVVAWSGGNHAQGVAAAAQLLSMRATIVMPTDAPAIKISRTKSYGAKVVLYDRATQSREEFAMRLAEESGATVVPSYDDPAVIAGQGTVGLELIEQALEASAIVERVLVCCGGGGLTAGVAIAIKDRNPTTRVYSIEPEAFDDTARSLVSGQREHVRPSDSSICDALLAPTPGELTFPINAKLLSGGLTVSDEDVRQAVRYAFHHLKLVVEPSGAVALAAAMSIPTSTKPAATAVIISGSNVDAATYAAILGES